jgi:hypothetical protein
MGRIRDVPKKHDERPEHDQQQPDAPAAEVGFGSFLGPTLSRMKSGADTAPDMPKVNWEALKRKVARRRERKQLLRRVERLERNESARRRVDPGNPRQCDLFRIVLNCKKSQPAKRLRGALIALCVDKWLEKNGKELRHVCPSTWTKIPGLPRLLTDARRHPRFKTRVKQFFSKVKVS